jgi:CheY-like chemotaxis protein
MDFNVDDRNIQNTNLPSIRILLADSEPSKIAQVISYTEQQFRPVIRVCNSYMDLLPMLRAELPEVILLGLFEKFNSFYICQECHQTWEHLPIVLLSRQTIIDDCFRQMAINRGATDVIPHNLLGLDRLFQGLLQPKPTTAPQSTSDKSQIRPLTPTSGETGMESPPELRDLAVHSMPEVFSNIECDQTGGIQVVDFTFQTPSQIAATVTVQTMLTAMKEITQIGNNYFGPLAQGNYWRKAHARMIDRFPALKHWSADHFGIISCNETILQSPCTEKDLQSLRSWVGVYLSECERIIVDFGDILKKSNLSPAALQLLSDLASSPKIT